jgi:hypothetical protein
MDVKVYTDEVWVDKMCVADLIGNELRVNKDLIKVVKNQKIFAQIIVWKKDLKVIAIFDMKTSLLMPEKEYREKYNYRSG